MNKNRKLGFSLIEISVVILIIGILIAAVNSGIALVNRSKIASAQNLSSNTAIHSMKDLVLWFEPSLPSSFDNASEGDELLLWSNESPSYNIGSAVQTDITKAPIYVGNSINNLPAVRLIDNNDHFAISEVSNLLEQSDLTIFILEKPDNGSSGKIISSTTPTNFEISYNISNNIVVKNSSGNAVASTAQYPGPNLHFITLYDGDSDSDFKIDGNTITKDGYYYYNNKKLPQSGSMPVHDIEIHSGSGSSRFATNTIGDIITIGHDSSAYVGNISEIIIFNRRLRKDELLDIFSYFESKYNLSLSI
jgi:prepilin-type N-terminal cleavage/methylation domain-containing protein